MGKAELRKYFIETYSPETGDHDYEIVSTISIDENGVDYLSTPEGDETTYFDWVYVGNRNERLRALGINNFNY